MLRYLLTGLALAALPSAGAQAACSVINAVRVCTGTYSVLSGIALDYTANGRNGDNGSDGGAFISAGSGAGGSAGGSLAETFQGSATAAPFSGNYTAQNVGVRVQSLGGSGGVGGYGYVGASGARGGDGAPSSMVNLSVTSSIIDVRGIGSIGIGAFSTGGNGGQGGNTTLSSGGGNGGNAGDGGQVSLSVDANTSVTITGSKDAVGILAESRGGVGGRGGSTDGGGNGGSGGTGGTGGSVFLSDDGSVYTTGGNATGVLAQSIGGGGGNGGSASGINVSGGGSQSSGNGGAVTVAYSGVSGTNDARSVAVLAQSIGGGGGAGGASEGIGTTGGSGSGGGYGGQVNVQLNQSPLASRTNTVIYTRGDYATAFLAQSVGGGGGSGGGSSGAFTAVGGNGSGGGNGGNVTATVNAKAYLGITFGLGSDAVLLQSVGGGGGVGGTALAGGVSYALSVGGQGGTGGQGGLVQLNNASANPMTITTQGFGATGVVGESTGGGGGVADWTYSGAAGPVSLAETVGGSGGDAGSGGSVLLNLAGKVTTAGDDSIGFLAQSVGGGGGDAGLAISTSVGYTGAFSTAVGGSGGKGGDGGNVGVFAAAGTTIGTNGASSDGILAQSVGGGGGDTADTFSGSGAVTGSLSLTVGGTGGNGGGSGTVRLGSSASVVTVGDEAAGVLSQSVAGGGGDGGISGSAALAGTASLGITLGSKGGSGNTAGAAYVSQTGNVTTSGNNATAVGAESLAGGGGDAGITATLAAGGTAALAASIGGGGGGGGSAGIADASYGGGVIYTSGALSPGVVAHSFGGGGGDGGIALGLTGAGTVSGNAAVGGTGAAAGQGGAVTVNVTGGALPSPSDRSLSGVTIWTNGADSNAIEAISEGGGGGDGGLAISGNPTLGSAGIGIAIGGSVNNGDAGGGTVTVNNSATLYAFGTESDGLVAASIGGGGGDGGMALTGTLTVPGGKGVSVSLGGTGGFGGNGTAVNVTNSGLISLRGQGGSGIVAQSIGGGGGDGGFAGSLAASANAAVNAGISVGRSGGSGGAGRDVNVTNSGQITARLGDGMAILAQSLGGGGGDGGSTGAVTLGGGSSLNASVSVGGQGGGGAFSQAVTVRNSGTLTTFGDEAPVILAESVGGGGGYGGFALSQSYAAGGTPAIASSVTVGGRGGTGSYSGAVGVGNTGSIVSKGQDAPGILAQSIGGGGGDGGFASSTSGALSSASSVTGSVAVGGSGGAGGEAAAVTVVNSGSITTSGGDSDGIIAESTGGGGGDGGAAKAVSASLGTKAVTLVFSVSIGGKGGASGNGRSVLVNSNTGNISVSGPDSIGILAQSIGGGGGDGGDLSAPGGEVLNFLSILNTLAGNKTFPISINVGGQGGVSGNGGSVQVNNTSFISATGLQDIAIEAESVGGGGGNGGFGLPGTVNVGGAGGSSGSGGYVNLTNSGSLLTTQNLGLGILAQSIGGGGGNGGDTSEDSLYPNLKPGIGLGGSGGSTGSGGYVQVTNSGDIETLGNYATAIMAESVGGGGGTGGDGVQVPAPKLILPGNGSAGGDGGTVNVTNSAFISTSGAAAYGILAQSVGGGGGVAGAYSFGVKERDIPLTGAALPGGFSRSGGGGAASSGNGGAVSVTNSGYITVSGAGSIGILAQSVGGGGGLIGQGDDSAFLGSLLNGNTTGGTVSLTDSGRVEASGANSAAVLLQSAGSVGAGTIQANVAGPIIDNNSTGTALVVSGGNANLVSVATGGSITGVNAIRAGSANDTVLNSGTINGSIDLGGGTNNLMNFENGVVRGGATISMGGVVSGTFTNDGVFVPGYGQANGVTTVVGAYKQDYTGSLFIDLDALPNRSLLSPRVYVVGNATLNGRIIFGGVPSSALLNPGTYTVTTISGYGVTNNLIGVSSADAVAQVLSTNAFTGILNNGLQSQIKIDYGLSGTASNTAEASVARAVASLALAETAPRPGAAVREQGVAVPLAAVSLAGGATTSASDPESAAMVAGANDLPIDDALEDVVQAPTEAALATIYESLSPQSYAESRLASKYAALDFNDTLLSGAPRAQMQSHGSNTRVWVDVSGSDYRSASEDARFTQRSIGPSMGFTTELAAGYKLGFAAGFTEMHDRLVGDTSGNGWRGNLGATLSHSYGPIDAAVALSGGTEHGKTDRFLDETGGIADSTGNNDADYGVATLRLSHRFALGSFEARPYGEANAVVLSAGGFTEHGSSPLNLQVASDRSVSLRGDAGVLLGGTLHVLGAIVQPNVQLGASGWLAHGATEVDAAFEGTPVGTPDLEGYVPNHGLMGDMAAQLKVATWRGMSVQLSYATRFDNQLMDQSYSARGIIPF